MRSPISLIIQILQICNLKVLIGMHDTAQQVFYADIAYWVELFLLILLFVSYYFASERQFKIHKQIIKVMVIVQTFLVIYMMNSLLFTYYGKNFIWHAIIGAITYLSIIYTYLLMTGKIPYKQLRVPKKYRRTLMIIVAVLWGLSILYGAFSLITIVD